MKSTFSILFYKKSALKRNGKTTIMGRITLNGKIAQFSLKCDVNPSDWNPCSQRVNGRTSEAVEINRLLDRSRALLYNYYREISERETVVTAEKVKNAFLGFKTSRFSLLELFNKHLEDIETKVGKDLSLITYKRYIRARDRLERFMREKYNISDIDLREVNYSFLCDFEIFLKNNYLCGHNATMKFIKYLRTIILIAKNNGWIYTDPFANYRFHTEKTDRAFLTQPELESIMKKKFTIKRLEQVRDVFIFSCFTGLAYIDVSNLRETNIREALDGKLWIIGKRTKTNVSFNIPLLEIPKIILEKYRGTLPDGVMLPVISNQKINAYLKEIADICGIDKLLTFHVARHTFATTVTLSKGVSIESVSKMLGHTNIKTTQIYARITNEKISKEMNVLADKLDEMNTKYAANF
ncbi:MAG: site-specific integrase [Dysgonamonadaceae bacterium]|jgi:site-specific recombinase XerD|nr:site-specific integrase [Dysgonamonadaceae bacterium]